MVKIERGLIGVLLPYSFMFITIKVQTKIITAA